MASTLEPAAEGAAGDGGELLRLSGISLDYGQIEALKDVNLVLYPSKVHAVVGEHGAGKTSLGMIISGNVRQKAGSIEFAGRRIEGLSTNAAHRLGIEMVYQQVQLNNFFSVAENLFFLDRQAARHGWMSQRGIARRSLAYLEANDFSLDPSTPVKSLNFPDRVLVSILAALQKKPRLLILDEALEKLSAANLHKVLRLLDEMKAEGMAILFITHRIDDVYDIADRVSIVKNGEILVTDEVGHIDKMNLLRLTYTQVYSLENSGNRKREFDQYFKYNEAVLLKLPVNLFVVDAEERIKIVNELCKKYFHLEEDSFVNRSLAELFGKGNDEMLALLREALRSEEGSVFYHVPLSIGGADTINNVRTLPIYDEDQRIGNVIIIEDITEFDKLQKQVILSEKLASVGLLAAGVAHEINNPLEIVYNYLKYIKLSFADAKLHGMVDELHEEITYIAGIVRNLLSLSGSAKAEREEIDINELIRSTIGLLRHSAVDKNISFTFESREKELFLTVNRNEFKQVILNLVKNSFEAMPGGGGIGISTSSVAGEDGRPRARIEFTDTGPGIQGSNLNDVFIPFYSTRKGRGENVGLGLSICYGIVKQHNGSLSVRNLEPSGCCFTITLPL
jgi:signal transduction histidine kinase/ABC-type molybdenum transport system ATPase subunit/photorepair protein PhrA